ncbi:MAG: PhoH family protein [Hyphomicrobiales bacterium]
MSTLRAETAEHDEVITFDDNRLLSNLFGEHDQHLALIEDRLGLQLTPRGNHVSMKGNPEAVESARLVLAELYDRLVDGFEITPGDVDGAVRIYSAEENRTPASKRVGKGAKPKTSSDGIQIKTRRKTILPRSPLQGDYIRALQSNEMTFGIGPAGTGKTYLAVACAAAALMAGEVDRIILSRPAVEAGERLGFLPGDLKEKVDPYLRPLYDALYDTMPGNQVQRGLTDETIEIAPLAFMRGRTLTRAFVILDEAQNTTPQQMKMFLTRLGEDSRMAITGDPSQVDLPRGIQSGLKEATGILEGVKGVEIVAFTERDVVRHPLVARIVAAYDKHERAQKK